MTATPTNAPTSAPATTPAVDTTLPVATGNDGRAHRIAVRAFAGLCVGACGTWAFLPLGPARVEVPEIAAGPVESPEPARVALDLTAFNAPLWVAPPPPQIVQAPPPPPPPPPLKWQLLAIVRESEGYKALVYDPDSDKLLVLGEGDQSGPRRIARVTPTSMDLRDPSGVRTLALSDQAGGRP